MDDRTHALFTEEDIAELIKAAHIVSKIVNNFGPTKNRIIRYLGKSHGIISGVINYHRMEKAKGG